MSPRSTLRTTSPLRARRSSARLRTQRRVSQIQTFLPYPDFAKTASVLDRQRLGKQRVEVLQIMNALCTPGYGWCNHPAVQMWHGYEYVLNLYSVSICDEWTSRGYKDTCKRKTHDVIQAALADGYKVGWGLPPWLGDLQLHLSHQSNLVRKDPEFYGPLFPGVPSDLEYVWPGAAG